MFTRYKKIFNHDSKYIDGLDKDHLVLVSEKIHGANFSIIYNKDTDEVKFASRSKIISGDNFYNVNSIKDELEMRMRDFVSDNLQYIDYKIVTVFGELYGNRVQYNPIYVPFKLLTPSFVAFDLYFDGEKKYTMNDFYDVLSTYFPVLKNKLMKLSEALELNVDIESSFALDNKVEDVSDNTMEGIVIQPLKSTYFYADGESFLIKKKSKKWSEKRKSLGLTSEEKKEIPKTIIEAVEKFSKYVTKNRLENVASKKTYLKKDFENLLYDFHADALEEMCEYDEIIFFSNNKHDKIFEKECKRMCVPLIKEHLND